MKRSYSGPVKAVILDWAGTTVDHGSLAPVRVLQEVFAKRGVPILEEEARRDMGVLKIDHIRKILFAPNVAARWREVVKREPTEADVESLFANFVPLHSMQPELLPQSERRPCRRSGCCQIQPWRDAPCSRAR